MILISGFHAIESEIINNLANIDNIYTSHRDNQRLGKIKSLAPQLKIKYVAKNELSSMLGDEKHQGIIAKINTTNILGEKQLKDFLLNQDNKLILILENITDTRNLGACIRSAVAFGVDCIILPNAGSAAINNNTYKTSAGTLSKINIFIVANLIRLIKLLKQNDFWVAGLDGYGATDINNYEFGNKNAIIMGSEDKGLRSLTKKSCDNLLRIPMSNKVESLNIAVATGITLSYLSRGNS